MSEPSGGYAFPYNGTFPLPLSPSEEEKFLQLLKNGDAEAKNTLIEHNLRLVAHIAKKYSLSTDSEDLISIGTIGLIKGINSFDPEKNTRLATYAARCIENEILMYLRAAKKHINDVYLQDPVSTDKEGNEITILDTYSQQGEDVSETVNLSFDIKNLYESIKSSLKPQERLVIELRYGLGKNEETTQREIAAMLGISRSYVSRIEKRAIKKLHLAMCGEE